MLNFSLEEMPNNSSLAAKTDDTVFQDSWAQMAIRLRLDGTIKA
jgi:hypothetical protein